MGTAPTDLIELADSEAHLLLFVVDAEDHRFTSSPLWNSSEGWLIRCVQERSVLCTIHQYCLRFR